MKKQEETRQTELSAKAAEFKALQAQAETVRFHSFLIFLISLQVHFLIASLYFDNGLSNNVKS